MLTTERNGVHHVLPLPVRRDWASLAFQAVAALPLLLTLLYVQFGVMPAVRENAAAVQRIADDNRAASEAEVLRLERIKVLRDAEFIDSGKSRAEQWQLLRRMEALEKKLNKGDE